jgi:hypothetical protein
MTFTMLQHAHKMLRKFDDCQAINGATPMERL